MKTKMVKIYGCTGIYKGKQEDSCGSEFSEKEAKRDKMKCWHCRSKLEHIATCKESELVD